MNLDKNVWYPHFKFTLQTIAIKYPIHPNDVSKKKYYDFIQNLPVLIPMKPIGKTFLDLLNKYPVTPYLSSRPSFMKWTHFIFNKINKIYDLPDDNYYDSLKAYYDTYKPKELKDKEIYNTRQRYIKFITYISISYIIYYLYNK